MERKLRTREARLLIDAAIRAYYSEEGSLYVAELVNEDKKYIQHRAKIIGVSVSDGRKIRASRHNLAKRRGNKTPGSILAPKWWYL